MDTYGSFTKLMLYMRTLDKLSLIEGTQYWDDFPIEKFSTEFTALYLQIYPMIGEFTAESAIEGYIVEYYDFMWAYAGQL